MAKNAYFLPNFLKKHFALRKLVKRTNRSLQCTIPCFFFSLTKILRYRDTPAGVSGGRYWLPIASFGLDQMQNPAYKKPAGICGNGIFIRCARFGVVGRL
jgi:hypothetical protein